MTETETEIIDQHFAATLKEYADILKNDDYTDMMIVVLNNKIISLTVYRDRDLYLARLAEGKTPDPILLEMAEELERGEYTDFILMIFENRIFSTYINSPADGAWYPRCNIECVIEAYPREREKPDLTTPAQVIENNDSSLAQYIGAGVRLRAEFNQQTTRKSND